MADATVPGKLTPSRYHGGPPHPATAMPTPAYDQLSALYTRLHRLGHVAAIAAWDRDAMMPPKGSEARAAALAELEVLMHGLRTDPKVAEWIGQARGEPLDDIARANLREMERDWRGANVLPAALVQAKSLATARCEHAWREQRPRQDWAGFLANFREVVRLAREEARLRAQALGCGPYDALLDLYEPGMTAAELDRIFGEVRTWLPELIARVQARQQGERVETPVGPFAVAAQQALGHEVMALLGFDFDAGRLDRSAHPFSGGVPEDVRITTRYREDDCLKALFGVIHETGHALYEQGLPRDWLGQPLGTARSFGIHESQSLSCEMQLARHPAFARVLAPLLVRHFGAQPAFAPDNLARLLTRVKPGLIRVDADEVTYPAHIILRYEIERALIEGGIEAEDIPALWEEKTAALLGLDVRGNPRDGCLQDIHWPIGAFGYFPSYTLGAMYAAQWFATLRREVPELDDRLAAGDLSPVFDWQRRAIWYQASRWTTPELVVRASGSALEPAHFRRHLESRYLG